MSNYRKAILITYPVKHTINEAISLANGWLFYHQDCDPASDNKIKIWDWSGKAEEVKEVVKEIKPDVIIFDETIKPTQIYNLASFVQGGDN